LKFNRVLRGYKICSSEKKWWEVIWSISNNNFMKLTEEALVKLYLQYLMEFEKKNFDGNLFQYF